MDAWHTYLCTLTNILTAEHLACRLQSRDNYQQSSLIVLSWLQYQIPKIYINMIFVITDASISCESESAKVLSPSRGLTHATGRTQRLELWVQSALDHLSIGHPQAT